MRRQLYLNGVTTSHYWIGVISYTFMVYFVVYLLIYLLGNFIFRISIFLRIDKWMLVLIMLESVIASASTSLFFGAIFTKTIAFTMTMVLIIIFSVIYSVFFLTVLKINIFAYILPTVGQISLLTILANES